MVRQAYAIVRANGVELKLRDLVCTRRNHILSASRLTDGSIMLHSFMTSSPEELEGFRRDVKDLSKEYKGLETVQMYDATEVLDHSNLEESY